MGEASHLECEKVLHRAKSVKEHVSFGSRGIDFKHVVQTLSPELASQHASTISCYLTHSLLSVPPLLVIILNLTAITAVACHHLDFNSHFHRRCVPLSSPSLPPSYLFITVTAVDTFQTLSRVVPLHRFCVIDPSS
eukprot:3412911-Pleurochrysis_carterae.AAC.2